MESLSVCIVAGVTPKTLLQKLFPIPGRSKYIEGVAGAKKRCNHDVSVSNGVNLCYPI